MPRPRLSYRELRSRERLRKQRRVRFLRDRRNYTFRRIADELGISVTWAVLLYHNN